ncbi:hypothetical protein [Flavobacterium sp. U410]|jgi:hypothetical protein
MKKLLFLSAIFVCGFSLAQEVEIKKDKVFLNGNEFLKYEKINIANHSFYDMNDNEIINFRTFNNETPDYVDDDFYVINFIEQKAKVESTDFSRIVSFLNSKKSCEKLIKWMVKDKVLREDGTIDDSKLENLIMKYNENIQDRTTR